MNKKFKNVKVNPVRIGHAIRRSLISIIALILIIILINLAPNYVKEGKSSSTKVIINNNNITKSLKNPVRISPTAHGFSLSDSGRDP